MSGTRWCSLTGPTIPGSCKDHARTKGLHRVGLAFTIASFEVSGSGSGVLHDLRDIVALARDARMSTSYKPALLKAIVRLQRITPSSSLTLLQLAEEYARLYWTQTVVYHLRQAASLSKEPEILQALRKTAQATGARAFTDVPEVDRGRLVEHIARTLTIDVLRRFHATLPVGAVPLYTWDDGDTITFTDAAVTFIRANAMMLEVVANYWWARYLEKINLLAPALLEKVAGDGARRSSLRWFYDRVAGVDEPSCFYCGISLVQPDERHVDHVIPWSFLLADPLWDLVLSCVPCNLSKSDRLPNRRFIDKLDALNEHRLAVAPSAFRGSLPLTAGGLVQLYDAALSVEWPNSWVPL